MPGDAHSFNMIHPALAERQAGLRALAAACAGLGTAVITTYQLVVPIAPGDSGQALFDFLFLSLVHAIVVGQWLDNNPLFILLKVV